MITLTHLRTLLNRALTHAANPAIPRLEGRTVAAAYLPRGLWLTTPDSGWTGHKRPQLYWRPGDAEPVDAVLDLTDPGTAHTLLVALALALGLDPGMGGLGVAWTRRSHHVRYVLADGAQDMTLFTSDVSAPDRPWRLSAPIVALEPDPIKALALAVRHVLEAP